MAAYHRAVTPCPACGTTRSTRTVRLRGLVRAALLVLPFLMGAVVGAPLLHDLVEGQDQTRLPLWRLVVVGACALVSALGAMYRARREVCPRCARTVLAPVEPEPSPVGTTRRTVLRASTAAAAATVSGAAGMLLPNRGWI